LSDAGEKLHLQEDESLENVVVFSQPGVLADTEWLTDHSGPWTSFVAHPRFDAVRSTLAIEPDSGRLYIADAWPRAAFDCGGLAALLEDHLQRHRAWRQALTYEDCST
jgi:hypothetical protein